MPEKEFLRQRRSTCLSMIVRPPDLQIQSGCGSGLSPWAKGNGSVTRSQVVVTDHVFPSREIEEHALTAAGADLVFGSCRTEDEVLELARDADVILTTYAPMTERVIDSLTRCKAIVRYGVGVDNVALAAATRRGIRVCAVPDYCIQEVSDHALALLLALARRVVVLDRSVHAGAWDYRPSRPIFRLEGQTLGLLGLGRIALALAAKARPLGLHVIAHDLYVTTAPEGVELVTLDDLLARADLLSIHVPRTESTVNLLNAERLAQMKPTAYIVNTSRGGIIDEEALARALEADRLAGAALDVMTREPPPADHPLLQSPKVVLTPHAAFFSEESPRDSQRKAVDEVIRALEGRPARVSVNGL